MGRPKQPKATKKQLLETAFAELTRHGFHGTSIQAILQRSDLTKGALFHHYPTKKALALAVLEQIVAPLIYERWLEPLEQMGNPIDILQALFRTTESRMAIGACVEHEKPMDNSLTMGCPLAQLAQEMAPLDADFCMVCDQILAMWREGVSGVLTMGQQQQQVRSDLDTTSAATFLISALEGAITTARQSADADQARTILSQCSEHLIQHLEWMRY